MQRYRSIEGRARDWGGKVARIDRSRLAAATFPVAISIATRFDDLDVQGHVNNVAGVAILQEARVDFNRVAGLPALMGRLRMMVASIAVDYAGELRHPAPVEVATGILAVGRTSFTLAQVARQGSTPCLYAEIAMVVADADGPTPIPPDLRAAYEALAIVDRTTVEEPA